jgi:hypothetical protein
MTKLEPQLAVSERRGMRRFEMRLPARIRLIGDRFQEFVTETHNVSARGIFFYLERPIAAGSAIEVTLNLPSHSTLSDSVRVRFTGRVVRVESTRGAQTGIATTIDDYEFLRSPELPRPVAGPDCWL